MADTFNLYQDGVQVATGLSAPPPGTFYRRVGLVDGQTYKFEITRVNAAGESPKSAPFYLTPVAPVVVEPPPGTPPPPPPPPPGGGIVVNIDQVTTPRRVSKHEYMAFDVQRYMRGGGITGPQKTIANDFLYGKPGTPGFVKYIVRHLGGGYSNSSAGVQLWGANDPFPTLSSGTDNWADGAHQGLDHFMSDLDAALSRDPGVGAVIVLHDIPVAINNGFTRTTSKTMTTWPPASFWDTTQGTAIVRRLLTHFSGKIVAISYGQEGKGVAGHLSDVNARKNFSLGATKLFTNLKASHPAVERWFPHFNFFATWSALSSRQSAVNALIAGGSELEANDRAIWAGLLSDIDPNLIDRITIDWSIVDSGTDTWAGQYDIVKTKTSLGYHLCRAVEAYMMAAWGRTLPIVHIENYADVNQSRQQWMSPSQQCALGTSMTINLTKHHLSGPEARWEPQADDPPANGVAPNADGEVFSWYHPDGRRTKLGQAAWDFQQAIPYDSHLFFDSSNDPDIEAIACLETNSVFINNKGSTPKDVAVVATNGNLAARTIPAYGHIVQTLP